MSIVNVLHSKDAIKSWSWDTGVCNFVPRDRILMYRTWTISDQIVCLFEQFFCYLIAGTLLYDLYCRRLRRILRSLIKKHCSVISIMSWLSYVCVIRHTVHGLSESESISSCYRTRDTIYSICSVKAKISWWLDRGQINGFGAFYLFVIIPVIVIIRRLSTDLSEQKVMSQRWWTVQKGNWWKRRSSWCACADGGWQWNLKTLRQ